MEGYIEVNATVRIPIEKIKDLITTAIEGGANYWAKIQCPKGWKEKYGSIEEIPLQGGNIEVFDVETDELLGVLNLATINVGLQLMADRKDLKGKHVPARPFAAIAQDNEDAETADVFMQLAVLGEIVFG